MVNGEGEDNIVPSDERYGRIRNAKAVSARLIRTALKGVRQLSDPRRVRKSHRSSFSILVELDYDRVRLARHTSKQRSPVFRRGSEGKSGEGASSAGDEELHERAGIFWLTSKMSRDHSRRDSCGIRISSREFHSKMDSIARGVTDVVVGSGALFGVWETGKSIALK